MEVKQLRLWCLHTPPALSSLSLPRMVTCFWVATTRCESSTLSKFVHLSKIWTFLTSRTWTYIRTQASHRYLLSSFFTHPPTPETDGQSCVNTIHLPSYLRLHLTKYVYACLLHEHSVVVGCNFEWARVFGTYEQINVVCCTFVCMCSATYLPVSKHMHTLISCHNL